MFALAGALAATNACTEGCLIVTCAVATSFFESKAAVSDLCFESVSTLRQRATIGVSACWVLLRTADGLLAVALPLALAGNDGTAASGAALPLRSLLVGSESTELACTGAVACCAGTNG